MKNFFEHNEPQLYTVYLHLKFENHIISKLHKIEDIWFSYIKYLYLSYTVSYTLHFIIIKIYFSR